jgi:hypothetical protein
VQETHTAGKCQVSRATGSLPSGHHVTAEEMASSQPSALARVFISGLSEEKRHEAVDVLATELKDADFANDGTLAMAELVVEVLGGVPNVRFTNLVPHSQLPNASLCHPQQLGGQ